MIKLLFFYLNNKLINKKAETAIKLANHERILKKEIRVCWKKNIREFSTEANVYIKNVDKNVTIKELDS